jgi:2-C-methyl-D-erythritol 4-phosphate cytidylyltransferase
MTLTCKNEEVNLYGYNLRVLLRRSQGSRMGQKQQTVYNADNKPVIAFSLDFFEKQVIVMKLWCGYQCQRT